MRRILAAAVLLTLTSACSTDEAPPAVAPAPAAPPSSMVPSPTVSTNVETDTACRLVDEATGSELENGLDDRATIEAIVLNAVKSNVESVKLAGVQMDGRYSAWSRADGDAESAAELVDAAGRLKAACVDAGVVD